MFATLQELKARVLPDTLRDSADYDLALQQLGSAVAKLFERHCNRQFGRAVGDTYEVAADQEIVSLPRYPVESISSIALRAGYGATPETLDPATVVGALNRDSGLLFLRGPQGDFYSRLTITYTGGLWVDTQGGQSLPTGATAMEADLLDAWYLQVSHLWASLDHTAEAMRPSEGGGLPGLSPANKLLAATIIPTVEAILRAYRRLS